MAPPRRPARTRVTGRDPRKGLVRRRHPETDLFDFFPDLPRPRRPTYAEQVQRMRESIALMQQRVRRNVEHHRAEAAAITAKWRSTRKRS